MVPNSMVDAGEKGGQGVAGT